VNVALLEFLVMQSFFARSLFGIGRMRVWERDAVAQP
jgi:hypothetical protein